MASPNSESEVKSWLTAVLRNEDIEDFSVKILGKSEEGDGYLGDIVFVQVSGFQADGSTKEYNLVLKCSKRSEALKKDDRFIDSFVNEIFVYEEVLPILIQFQKEKEIGDIFDRIPKCYGTLSGDIKVIVLENLKESGYDLWPRRETLTRNHIELVMKAYAQLHASSAALKIEQPDKFQQILNTLQNNLKSFFNPNNDMAPSFKLCIEYAADVLQNDIDESILLRWRNLAQNVVSTFLKIRMLKGFEVILHGDCWSNNFMFKHKDDARKPTEVVIIDWQVSRCGSPVHDLAYFLFTCISKEDIENLDDILSSYYKSFSTHLKKLGVNDPSTVYSFDQLMEEWNNQCIAGIILATMLVKVCLAGKNDIVDMAANAEMGKKFGSNFTGKVADEDAYKNRIRPIVEYAAKKGFI